MARHSSKQAERKGSKCSQTLYKILLYLQSYTKLKPEGLCGSLKQKIQHPVWVPVQKRPTFPQLIPSYSPILQQPCSWLCAHRLAAGKNFTPGLYQALGYLTPSRQDVAPFNRWDLVRWFPVKLATDFLVSSVKGKPGSSSVSKTL